MARLIMDNRRTVLIFLACFATLMYTTIPLSLFTAALLLLSVTYLQGYTWQIHPLLLVLFINAVHLALHALDRHHDALEEPIMFVSIFLECLSFAGVILWPIPTIPRPTGHYRVATHLDTWTAFEGQDARRLSIRVWYPSAQRHKPSNARYLFAPVAASVTQSAPAPLRSLFPRVPQYLTSHVHATRTNSIFGGKLAAKREKYPVVLFSHDMRCSVDFYTALLEDVASHGYVVFALYHDDAPAALPLHQRREADVAHALARIGAYDSDPTVKFGFTTKNNRVDLERAVFHQRLALKTNGVAYIGHGLGGLTVLGSVKKAVAGVVAIDPALSLHAVPPLSVPALLIRAERRSPSAVERERLHDLETKSEVKPTTLLFRAVSSMHFTDAAHIASRFLGSSPASWRRPGLPAQALACLRRDIREFLRTHLKRKPARPFSRHTT